MTVIVTGQYTLGDNLHKLASPDALSWAVLSRNISNNRLINTPCQSMLSDQVCLHIRGWLRFWDQPSSKNVGSSRQAGNVIFDFIRVSVMGKLTKLFLTQGFIFWPQINGRIEKLLNAFWHMTSKHLPNVSKRGGQLMEILYRSAEMYICPDFTRYAVLLA